MAFDLGNPMLAMGLSLLANPRDPSRSLLAGAAISSQFQQRQQRQRELEAQQAQAQQQQAMRSQIAEQYLLANPNDPQAQLRAQAFGGGLLDASTLFPQQPELTGMLGNLQRLSPGASGPELLAQYRDLQAASAPSFTFEAPEASPAQSKYEETRQRGLAELEMELAAGARVANETLPTVRRMRQLAPEVRKGIGAGIRTQLAEVFGRDVSSEREYDALMANVALGQRDKVGPGVMSDTDIQLLLDISGGRESGGSALDAILARIERDLESKIKRFQSADKYRQQHGNLYNWTMDIGALSAPADDTSEAGTRIDMTLQPKPSVNTEDEALLREYGIQP